MSKLIYCIANEGAKYSQQFLRSAIFSKKISQNEFRKTDCCLIAGVFLSRGPFRL